MQTSLRGASAWRLMQIKQRRIVNRAVVSGAIDRRQAGRRAWV
ncbi:hypothetical protein PCAR4_60340 [Paraburkholderia caribensis]|nr:hypothetical protein PCAR4_60340 [Paraburkholderia caribensis]